MVPEMTDYLKRAGRFFLILGSVPPLIGFIAAWFAGLGFILVLFGFPAAALILIVGSIVFAVRGIRLARAMDGGWRDKLLVGFATPIMLARTVPIALPLLRTGPYTGTWTRLFANPAHYERIIAAAQRERGNGSYSEFRDDHGVTYIVDYGPPVRVAFNPEGMLDNWSGIIYDPSHQVELAKGFDPVSGKFYAPERVTKIFGGDLVACRRLYGDYYDCSFT